MVPPIVWLHWCYVKLLVVPRRYFQLFRKVPVDSRNKSIKDLLVVNMQNEIQIPFYWPPQFFFQTIIYEILVQIFSLYYTQNIII
jgi:hypothetical protein